ncbi:MAG: hypothetical protein AAF202_03240, partial [Pseudomonadota bacterium]
MKPRLILNIGYAKTGTSWWQAQVFPKLDLNYLGRDYKFSNSWNPFRQDKKLITLPCQPAVQGIVDYLSLGFNAAAESEALDNFDRLIDRSRVNLVSHENILRPFSYDTIFDRLKNLEDRYQLTLLVFTRKQQDIILSRHMHDLRMKKFLKGNKEVKYVYEPGESCRWPYCQTQDPCACR